MLPDASISYDSRQTVTTLFKEPPSGKGGRNAENTVCRTNSDDSDLCFRSPLSSAILPDEQIQCQFCDVVTTENGLADDAQYARICEGARRNQCRRRTVARQRRMTTGTVPLQHVPRRHRQSQPQVAAGELTKNDRLPVAKEPPEMTKLFHVVYRDVVASRDVEPEDYDIVLAANLPMMRTVYQPGSGRSVLHIDDIGSQFRCDVLDEFLLENGVPANISEVPGMSTGGTAGLESFGSAQASPGDDWEPEDVIPDPDIRAVLAATSCSGAMTSEPPMMILPVGIFPADIIDIVFEHPGVDVATMTEMLLARSKASISGQHRANAKALLNVAVLSARRAVDAVIFRLHSLRDQWDADDPTRAGDTATYQEAVQDAVSAYRRQMSCNPRL